MAEISKGRTDLAVETREEIAEKGVLDDGILFSEEAEDGFLCSEIKVTTPKAAELCRREEGTYITVEFGKIWLKGFTDFEALINLMAKKIRALADYSGGLILIAGLGNVYITADALGPKAVSKVIMTRHIKNAIPELYNSFGDVEMAGILPGVLAQTGIESADLIQAAAAKLAPSLTIIIDSLASRKLSRLAATVQLSDTGISPGSGVGNHRRAIGRELLGCNVISIGVPTVVDAATLSYDVVSETCNQTGLPMDDRLTRDVFSRTLDKSGGNFFVTPKESDIIIEELGKIVGFAINRAFFADLSIEEMARIVL